MFPKRAKKVRSLLKTLSYRVICTAETFLVSLLIMKFVSGTVVELASIIAAVLFFTKLGTYYGHERFWNRVLWGLYQEE